METKEKYVGNRMFVFWLTRGTRGREACSWRQGHQQFPEDSGATRDAVEFQQRYSCCSGVGASLNASQH